MRIEVYRNGRLSHAKLFAYYDEGSVVTFLRQFKSLLGTMRPIPLSDELAHHVLGTERRPCPYVGTEPRMGFYSEGYCANRREGIEGLTIISLHCTVCGYDGIRKYDPTLLHPEHSYLVTSRFRSPLTNAGWDDTRGVLTASNSDDRLILWLKPAPTRNSEAAAITMAAADTRAVEAAFPNASVLGEKSWLRILRQPQHDSAENKVQTH